MKSIIAAIACSLVCLACAKPPYFSEASSPLPYSERLESFTFLETTQKNKTLENVIKKELQRRNYLLDTTKPDFLIIYQAYFEQGAYFFKPKPLLFKRKTKAETLVLQMVNLKSGKTVWRGAANNIPVNSLQANMAYFGYSIMNSK